jgi:hypothetical protein
MRTALEDGLASDDRQQDIYWSVVSGLVSLIERTRTASGTTDFVKEIEGAEETSVEAVLPTVDWSDCNRRLREALYVLLEARPDCKAAGCSKPSKQVAA